MKNYWDEQVTLERIECGNHAFNVDFDEQDKCTNFLNEDYEELFTIDELLTKEQALKYVRLYSETWEKAFSRGERFGKNSVKAQIKEVVSIFAAGFKEDEQ